MSMDNRRKNRISIVVAVAICFVMLLAVNESYAATDKNTFSVTGDGICVRECLRDGKHYLFLPSDIATDELTITCNHKIYSSSKGSVSEDKLSFSASFDDGNRAVLKM